MKYWTLISLSTVIRTSVTHRSWSLFSILHQSIWEPGCSIFWFIPIRGLVIIQTCYSLDTQFWCCFERKSFQLCEVQNLDYNGMMIIIESPRRLRVVERELLHLESGFLDPSRIPGKPSHCSSPKTFS
jgi:hypothetical protein